MQCCLLSLFSFFCFSFCFLWGGAVFWSLQQDATFTWPLPATISTSCCHYCDPLSSLCFRLVFASGAFKHFKLIFSTHSCHFLQPPPSQYLLKVEIVNTISNSCPLSQPRANCNVFSLFQTGFRLCCIFVSKSAPIDAFKYFELRLSTHCHSHHFLLRPPSQCWDSQPTLTVRPPSQCLLKIFLSWEWSAHSHHNSDFQPPSQNISKLSLSAHSHSATTTSPASQYLFSSLSNLFQTWFLLQVNFVANIGGDFFWQILVHFCCKYCWMHFCWTANTEEAFLLDCKYWKSFFVANTEDAFLLDCK